jgi:hypothetical protein
MVRMRQYMPLQYISRLLLLVMLSVAVNGAHGSAHAAQRHFSAAGEQAPGARAEADHHCPCSPLEEHNDYDGCDTCINCVCHAPLTVQQFKLGYDPIVLSIRSADPFKHLPEVFLSKFIPPQNPA